MLERAVMVALYHTRPIELLDVPKKKTGYQETPVTTDPCAFGIYPDLPQIEAAGKGRIISEIEHYFHTQSFHQVQRSMFLPGSLMTNWS